MLVAAGNSGSEIKTIGAPATSKSCVSVGATENINTLDDDDKLDSIDLATFSSRGPKCAASAHAHTCRFAASALLCGGRLPSA